jgi:hypothetical protein
MGTELPALKKGLARYFLGMAAREAEDAAREAEFWQISRQLRVDYQEMLDETCWGSAIAALLTGRRGNKMGPVGNTGPSGQI